MRPWPPIAALLLACLAPAPAAAVGVDAPMVQEAVELVCVDMTRISEGDFLRLVTPPPCGPDAHVSVRYCDGKLTIEVELVWEDERYDYHLVRDLETGLVEKIVDVEDDDDCP